MRQQPLSEDAARIGRYLARYYGQDDGTSLHTSAAARSELSLYRKRSIAPVFGHIEAPALDGGFLVTVALACYQERLPCRGRLSDPVFHAADSLRVRDLARDYAAYLCGPFDFLFLHVTQRSLTLAGTSERTFDHS